MKTLHFSTTINAPKKKVWHTMLDDSPYRDWSSVFKVGSFYRGDWSEGSKILFLGPDPTTGAEGGMVSRIAENRKYEFISVPPDFGIHRGIPTRPNAPCYSMIAIVKIWSRGAPVPAVTHSTRTTRSAPRRVTEVGVQ